MDPGFLTVARALGPSFRPPLVTNIEEYRAYMEPIITKFTSGPPPSNVTETKHLVKSFDGVEIEVYVFTRDDAINVVEPQQGLLYYHGGGVVSCKIDDVSRTGCVEAAAFFGVPVFAVEYRLAPEHPYPTPVEDGYAALEWVSKNASQFKVDPARLGLLGFSGGGCVAAGVSILARDRQLSPPIARQLLVYPMLDDMAASRIDTSTPQGKQLASGMDRVVVCWDAYIGAEKRGNPDADVPSDASPGRAENLAGLPFTYLECGTLDPLRDETLAFASKLTAAGVETELHLYAGVPHAFDLIAPSIPLTGNAMQNRLRVVRSI